MNACRIFVWTTFLVVLAINELLAESISLQPTLEQRRKMGEVFKGVKNKLVIVECGDSCGSGFVMAMEEGKKFFITNKHVVEKQKSVVARLLNGKKLVLGAFQVATNRDLVRFLLPDETESLRQNSHEPNIGDSVFVFGNSDGGGVVTDLFGEVIGVGPENIEVSARFVHGNSGSAVFNDSGEVIGVATFATHNPDPNDWAKQDTRFKDVRRFAVRFVDVAWQDMKYSNFYKKCVAEEKKRQEEGGVVPQVSARFVAPKMYSVTPPRSYMQNIGSTYIKSDITLSIDGNVMAIKRPIIRVCVLIRGVNGLHMRDCILTEAGSSEGRSSPPVFLYGNRRGGIYHTDGGTGVYFLEALSYWNGLLPKGCRKGIKYFDKQRDSSQTLFTIHNSMIGGRPPEIICFRFECWQNGALAGVYNSRGITFLKSRGIPVDWYVKEKHSDLFDYSNINFHAGSSAFPFFM